MAEPHASLNLATSNSYKPIQDFESKQVMYEFLKYCQNDSEAYYDVNRRYSASLILTITYGHRVKYWNDDVVSAVYAVLDHFTKMTEPGAWLVDTFPLLAKLPSWMVQNWWEIGRQWHKEDSATYLRLYRDLVEQVKAGTAPDCFVKDSTWPTPRSMESANSGQPTLQALWYRQAVNLRQAPSMPGSLHVCSTRGRLRRLGKRLVAFVGRNGCPRLTMKPICLTFVRWSRKRCAGPQSRRSVPAILPQKMIGVMAVYSKRRTGHIELVACLLLIQ